MPRGFFRFSIGISRKERARVVWLIHEAEFPGVVRRQPFGGTAILSVLLAQTVDWLPFMEIAAS